MTSREQILSPQDPMLVTGAAGFIGVQVVRNLVNRGFRRIRCLVRPGSNCERLLQILTPSTDGDGPFEIFKGNLLSPDDCRKAVKDAAAVIHLAAGRGEKSYPDAFMNSVVTTRNLLDALLQEKQIRRFVNVSSFSVYSNREKRRGRLLDEEGALEDAPHLRGDAYTYAKVKQEEIVFEYVRKHGLPVVTLRPGSVYGPGNEGISGRVGVGTFGIFLHLGGGNLIPLSYVDNCAEAIVLATITAGIDGQVFNVVDDDLPTSRRFFRLYKRNVRWLRSIYLPHALSFGACWLWEAYSRWSEGQLPPTFNRRVWHAYWKRTTYSNRRLKEGTGWQPVVSTSDALSRFFASCRQRLSDA